MEKDGRPTYRCEEQGLYYLQALLLVDYYPTCNVSLLDEFCADFSTLPFWLSA